MIRQLNQTSKTFLTIRQNTGILLLVNLVGAVIGFLMAAALGRGLGDSGFGQYSFVMTWLLSLILFTEFGLSTVLTRDLAAHPQRTHSYLINSLAGKLLLSLPASLFLLFFAPWLTPQQNPDVILALRWGLIFLYGSLFYSSFTAVFKAHQIMTPILWLTLIGQIVLFAGTLILLLARQPLFTLILWHGITLSLQCLLAAIFYKKRIAFHSKPVHDEPVAPKNTVTSARPAADAQNSALVMTGSGVSKTLVKSLILSAWPFALAGFLAALQMRANVLILAYIAGNQALGWYAAANRFVETGKQLPGAFYVAILPALAAMAGDISRRPKLRKTFRQAQLGLLAFALLASLGALLLAQPILTLTYGPAYQPATLTLQILTLSLIPATQNSLAIVYLYARGDEKFVNVLMTVGIVVNLSLCFLLIPTWGPAGTAIALLMAESVLYLPYRYRVNRLAGLY